MIPNRVLINDRISQAILTDYPPCVHKADLQCPGYPKSKSSQAKNKNRYHCGKTVLWENRDM